MPFQHHCHSQPENQRSDYAKGKRHYYRNRVDAFIKCAQSLNTAFSIGSGRVLIADCRDFLAIFFGGRGIGIGKIFVVIH